LGWSGLRIGSHLALCRNSEIEPGEHLQLPCLYYVIIIIFIIIEETTDFFHETEVRDLLADLRIGNGLTFVGSAHLS